MRGQEDTYKEVRTFVMGNWTIRVHIPDLTDEERARRMKRLERAAADVLKEQMRNEKNNNFNRAVASKQ